jgi:tRNA modification GTPase
MMLLLQIKKRLKKDLKSFTDLNIPIIIIANKIDLISEKLDIDYSHIKLSAKDKKDTEKIKTEIHDLFTNQQKETEGVIISNLRHFEALENASIELKKVKGGLDNDVSGDFLAMDIRQVLYHIGTITGEISSDELLGNIFANFCIGK